MAGILEELQRNIISNSMPVSTVLRQMKLAAAKLKTFSVEKWVDHELKGYSSEEALPSYRIVRGVPKALNPYHGWIPILQEDGAFLEWACEGRLAQPIGELETLIKDGANGTLTFSFPPKMQSLIMKNLTMPFPIGLRVHGGSIATVISTVRDTALEWVIGLERAGITGDSSFSFSEAEIKRAESMTINNYGNLSGIFGDHNNARDLISGAPTVAQEIAEKTRMNIDNLVRDGFDRSDLVQRIEAIEKAAASGEKSALASAVEGLKSKLMENMGSMAAVGLVDLCRQIFS